MSLRFRLIALVMGALVTSLALGGVVIVLNASRSVRAEMRAALLVGHQTVDAGLGEINRAADPRRGIDALVASFRGNRHLRVSITASPIDARVDPVRGHRPFGKVPAWFTWLIRVAPEADRVPIRVDGRSLGTLVIETDPQNEILEAWNELSGSLVVLALFCGLTIVLIYLFAGRALRPLDRLAAALEEVGRGNYGRLRVGDRLTPELARLCDCFNRMATRLAAADAENRRLNEQLLTLQEEERSDIARDLHDEIGPLLFAINVDVGNVRRLLDDGKTAELATHVHAIADVARDLQRHVRGMLGRLRPIGLGAFGLGDALAGLVGFWRRRRPEIHYRLNVAADCQALGDRVATTLYRIVQECLSNAVRHGKPTAITICVDRDRRHDQVIVAIVDDGPGLCAQAATGYGLIGMEERVRALGGRLTFANRTSGGLAVTAALPLSPAPGLSPTPALPLRRLPEAAR